MRTSTRITMVGMLVAALTLVFVFAGSGMDFDYVIPKRLLRLATIVIGGICVALSSVMFQTPPRWFLARKRAEPPISSTRMRLKT